MATIQVREIPEATYETIRRRARREGKSIQAYMRDRIVQLAEMPTKEEALEKIERVLRKRGPLGASAGAIAADVASERR